MAYLRRVHQRVGPHVYPQLTAVVLFRLSVAARRLHPALGRAAAMFNYAVTGADVDAQATIAGGLVLSHPSGVVIGPGVVAGARLRLSSGVTLGADHVGFPLLGDDVTVWTKASVVGPARIGDGAVIGAHALAIKDVPARSVATGVPATSRAIPVVAE